MSRRTGATVRVGPRTAFEPDAPVAPLPMSDELALDNPDPVIVVEVLPPGSVRFDLADKAIGCSKVPSISHYLVTDPVEKEIICHRRGANAASDFEPPQIFSDGTLSLDPPGFTLGVCALCPAGGVPLEAGSGLNCFEASFRSLLSRGPSSTGAVIRKRSAEYGVVEQEAAQDRPPKTCRHKKVPDSP